MKAFKSIDFSFETKAVISYAFVLSFISFFIMLSPVFAQQEDEFLKNKPQVKIDVNKQYDNYGNIIGYDSSFSWTWMGKNLPVEKLDSVFKQLHSDFEFSWDDYNILPADSLDISFFNSDNLDKYFDRDFNLDNYFPDEQFSEQFSEKQDAYISRFNEYLKEHQRLIEKYFREPFKEEENLEIKPNNNINNTKSQSANRTGRI
ncbi:MAG: hypothetical protein B6D61_07080 [Bacteroidetes bacterium 4484_249]|nr:MAG: hypothetical protein B6D61_07080 [Bacteroidetes bacterium 4484_249]